jgi:hypothetical protein
LTGRHGEAEQTPFILAAQGEVRAMQLPDLSKESLFNFPATVSLLLTISHVLWPKFAELLAMIWRSFVDAVHAYEAFRDRHEERAQGGSSLESS